jgi:hypothetical protein
VTNTEHPHGDGMPPAVLTVYSAGLPSGRGVRAGHSFTEVSLTAAFAYSAAATVPGRVSVYAPAIFRELG